MIRPALFSAFLAMTALPAMAAENFRSVNHLDVTVSQSDPLQITVFGPTELWAKDYWCAAGDIAFRKLGLPFNARLQVTRCYAPADQSVVFSQGGTRSGTGVISLARTVRVEGSNFSMGQARSYCADRILRSSR